GVLQTPMRGARSPAGAPPNGTAASAANPSARSPIERAITPTVSNSSVLGLTPNVPNRPKLGFRACTPQNAAGRITEPPVCVPVASGTMKSATAAAEPLDEPPGVCPGLCGLVVAPAKRLANSVVTVLPTITAPAARGSATVAASAGGRWRA